MTNPYSMPQAELTETVGTETYEPKFFALDGRIGRLRYWAYSIGYGLLTMPIMFLTAGVGAMTGSISHAGAGGGVIGTLLGYLVSFVITIVLARRRLQDLGQSPWLAGLMLIPFVNAFFALYLLFAGGDAEANEYGPPPSPNPFGVKLLAWILPIIALVGILAAIAIPAYSDYVAKARAAQMGQ